MKVKQNGIKLVRYRDLPGGRDRYLYLLLLLPLVHYLVFRYIPMYGVTIAFKDFNIFMGILGSDWNGLTQFREIFGMREFYRVLRNTLMLNGLDLLVGFPVPIILALIVNEIRSTRYKRTVQTLLYLPYFLSWVIIGGIVLQVFAPGRGLVNVVLKNVGLPQVDFLTTNINWVITYVGVGIWQGAGWGTIIYLAAMAGINPELYEAAEIDGAGRFARIRFITIPNIMPTAVILLILNVGRIAAIGFDRPFIMGNPLVADYANVISTYVYDIGLRSMRFNIATAVGLFQSVVGLIFLMATNWLAERNGLEGIYK